MKKVSLYFLLSVFIISFNACKKYAEGPSFTLLSKKSRAANVWVLDKYYENDVDKTTDAQNVFKDFKLIIDKGNMKYSKSFTSLGILPYGESGTWKFSADQNNLEFTPDNTIIQPYSWKIIKLKDKSIGFTYTTNSVVVKVYLKE